MADYEQLQQFKISLDGTTTETGFFNAPAKTAIIFNNFQSSGAVKVQVKIASETVDIPDASYTAADKIIMDWGRNLSINIVRTAGTLDAYVTKGRNGNA